MTDDATTGGWFEDSEVGSLTDAQAAIQEGTGDVPRKWPGIAVETGVVESVDDYYEWLHTATVHTAEEGVREREGAADQQVVQAVRALDDCARIVNELRERVSEWAQSYYGESNGGAEYVEEVAGRAPENARERRIVRLATVTVALEEERVALREFVEEETTRVAPNLAAVAGPVLAARLIGLAGGLGALAKVPSGTVQVLGAEDALFAHLRGQASSPKHGVIYTHESVRGTPRGVRGKAARAVAGKLSIAARIDYYSGDLNPDIQEELAERIAVIRSEVDG